MGKSSVQIAPPEPIQRQKLEDGTTVTVTTMDNRPSRRKSRNSGSDMLDTATAVGLGALMFGMFD